MKHAAREKRKQKVVGIWEKHYPDISVEEMEGLTGYSYRTIYRYLQESGCRLPPKKQKQIDPLKVKRAHALYHKHGKVAKVARIMGMSSRQIHRYLKISL